MRDPGCLLFLHIPKTAGTSFRLGAIKALGTSRCHFDYGRKSQETSGVVRKYVYENQDLFRFSGELLKNDCRLLAGHFKYPKYGPLFRSDRVLSFCREPGMQLMSHYSHSIRHNRDSRSLGEFLSAPDGGGLQTRMLRGIPIEAVGFVGVADRYEESLRVLHQAYGLEIKAMRENANPDRFGDQPYVVPTEMAQAFAAARMMDIGVYRRANALLDQRLASLDGGYGYVHGAIQAANDAVMRGFAFNGGGVEEPVEVELVVNGKPSASCSAVIDRPGLRGVGVPRHGYVGFEFKYRQPLKPGDLALVRVASSEQVLGQISMNTPVGESLS